MLSIGEGDKIRGRQGGKAITVRLACPGLARPKDDGSGDRPCECWAQSGEPMVLAIRSAS